MSENPSAQDSGHPAMGGKGRKPRVGLVYHPVFLQHRTRGRHPECPERLTSILDTLDAEGLTSRLERLRFSPATPEDLALVHDPAYVELLRSACEEGFPYIGDHDTHLCAESFDVACLAAGGVLAGCDAVLDGRLDRVFCAVRPPGHHAEADHALGFCLINHVALAAEHLVKRRGLERVAIVDFDVHHGNGTQQVFANRADVLYLSLHEHPLSLEFPGTGYRDEIGTDAGEGFTHNVFLPHGCNGEQYLEAVEEKVLPRLVDFAPQLLLLSAGFDAQATEEIAHLNLRPADYFSLTGALVEGGSASTAGRVVSVLEGGYELGGLGACVAAHVASLLAVPMP